jgi:hypothetical protein
MTTRNQTRRMLQSAAFFAALLLVAAPAALAAPQGYSAALGAPAVVNTPMPALSNAPKPDVCFLSSPGAFANVSASKIPSTTSALAAADINSTGSTR